MPRKVRNVITIREVMNRNVLAVGAEWTVEETIEFLTRSHISGSPVVSAKGELVGMISERALLDVVFDHLIKDAPVSQYMTTELHTVQPDEPLARAAQLFALYAHRRLPVVENGNLIGIITCRDLMNYSLRTNHAIEDPLVALIPSLATLN